MASRNDTPPALPWTFDQAQVDAVFAFVQEKAFMVYADVLGVSKARMYGVIGAGRIVEGESHSAVMAEASGERVTVCHAYALAETLKRLGRLSGNGARRAEMAGNTLFALGMAQMAIERGNAEEAAQAIVRVWINATVAGWTADFNPLARRLAESHAEQVKGARRGGQAKKAEPALRDTKVNEAIAERIHGGETYNAAIAGTLNNWPDDWGPAPTEKTLRNRLPKKIFFPNAGQAGKATR